MVPASEFAQQRPRAPPRIHTSDSGRSWGPPGSTSSSARLSELAVEEEREVNPFRSSDDSPTSPQARQRVGESPQTSPIAPAHQHSRFIENLPVPAGAAVSRTSLDELVSARRPPIARHDSASREDPFADQEAYDSPAKEQQTYDASHEVLASPTTPLSSDARGRADSETSSAATTTAATMAGAEGSAEPGGAWRIEPTGPAYMHANASGREGHAEESDEEEEDDGEDDPRRRGWFAYICTCACFGRDKRDDEQAGRTNPME